MESSEILALSRTISKTPRCTKNGQFYILDSDYFAEKDKETPEFLKKSERDEEIMKDFDENFDSIDSRKSRIVGYLDLYEEEVSLKALNQPHNTSKPPKIHNNSKIEID